MSAEASSCDIEALPQTGAADDAGVHLESEERPFAE
jgi:hypothetical protein